MVLILIILGLILAAVILAIKYFMAYAKLISHKSYDRAAEKEMRKIKYRDPKITCDYCGAVIDTLKYKTCPQCGASYDRDQEWTDRFTVNQDWVNERANAEAKTEINRARAEASNAAKKLKRVLIILGCIIGALVALGVVLMIRENKPQYASDSELNEYSYENYKEAEESLNNDGVIVDQDGVSISVSGIYKDDYRYKLGFHIVNKSGQDIHFSMSGSAINNYAYNFTFLSEDIRKNADITIYSNINGFSPEDTGNIESIIFSDIEVRDLDYNEIFKENGCVKLTTDADKDTAPVMSEGKILFENDYIVINGIGFYEDNEGYYVEVLNKTAESFELNLDGMKMNDSEVDAYGIYGEMIPAGCLLKSISVYSHDEVYTKREADDIVTASFSVRCSDHPEYNFSTGYLELQ